MRLRVLPESEVARIFDVVSQKRITLASAFRRREFGLGTVLAVLRGNDNGRKLRVNSTVENRVSLLLLVAKGDWRGEHVTRRVVVERQLEVLGGVRLLECRNFHYY